MTSTRMPDEVRDALVRAVLAGSVTMVLIMATVLNVVAGSWAWVFNIVLVTLAVVVSVWCGADIWVARQTAAQQQRHGRSSKRW